jgi:hypothetical protein
MTDPHVDAALAFLRGHTKADLQFDEHMRPLKYVVAPDGRLISPVMVAMINAVDTVLFIPSNEDGAMEVMVTLEQFDERTGEGGGAADRWRIYHGEPEDVRWAFMSIDSARFEGVVVDGMALQQSNSLATDQSRLCKMMNESPEALRQMCLHFSKFTLEKPVMVGIDPQGFDVRARFEVVRVQATAPMNSPEKARLILKEMSKEAEAGVAGSSRG